MYSSLRTCSYLSILGSLGMLKIISTILRKIFWISKGETTLVCLPAKPLHALVLSLALTSLFVQKSIFVLTFRKEQPNLSFLSFWFYFITVIIVIVKFWILIFTLLCILRITVWEFPKRSTPTIIIFIVSFSGSVDTIVFCKTGNHLPQCLWFSNSFFTVDGCIDCVKGILDS